MEQQEGLTGHGVDKKEVANVTQNRLGLPKHGADQSKESGQDLEKVELIQRGPNKVDKANLQEEKGRRQHAYHLVCNVGVNASGEFEVIPRRFVVITVFLFPANEGA